MPHSLGLCGGDQIARCFAEELEHRGILEGRRVGQVDQDLCIGELFSEPFAGDRILPRLGRACRDLMALSGQPCGRLGPGAMASGAAGLL